MQKNVIVIEKTDGGYTAYSNIINGVVSYGDTLKELKSNFIEALEFHIEGMIEDGDEIPTEFKGKYELYFDIDLPQFLEYLSNRVNESFMADAIGVNRSLFAQYKSGAKKPSKTRKDMILQSFKKLGEDLVSIC